MLSKIAGLLKGEMSRAASMFQALQSQFVGLLEAYRDKLPREEAPAPAEVASEVEAAPEAPEESGSPEPVAEAPAEAEADTKAAEAEADGGSSPDETEPSTDDT